MKKERFLAKTNVLNITSRFVLIAKDQVAKDHRVRIICPDRPGFGGTTNVDVADRVTTWLKVVPALLQHLDIRYVSIVAHSGGTIYALNTMLYLRHILHPTQPYVALCAPWVHPSHSGAPLMKFVGNLPLGLLNRFDAVAGLINNRFQPIVGFSSGLSSGLLSAYNKSPSISEDDASRFPTEEQLHTKIMSRVYSEDVHGLTSDALLLLKRAENTDIWGPWLDLDSFVPLLAELENNRALTTDSRDQVSTLTVEVFFAEKDSMIGTGAGPKWFDECWRPDQRGNYIHYNSTFVEGTDHDNLLDLQFGIPQQIFSRLPEHGQ